MKPGDKESSALGVLLLLIDVLMSLIVVCMSVSRSRLEPTWFSFIDCLCGTGAGGGGVSCIVSKWNKRNYILLPRLFKFILTYCV